MTWYVTSRDEYNAALGPIALHLMTLQFFSVMKETSLASVPFFLFMGYLLEQSGLMERLFRGIQQLLAGVKGSLYIAVLVTATICAAARTPSTGSCFNSPCRITRGSAPGATIMKSLYMRSKRRTPKPSATNLSSSALECTRSTSPSPF